MTRTLVQIRKQIDKLEKEAARVRANEVAGVVQRIKTAIGFYGLTEGDLFGATAAAKGAKRGRKPGAAGAKTKKAKKVSVIKYRDKDTGKTWTGHGKRPGWFVQAIDAGMKAEDLAV